MPLPLKGTLRNLLNIFQILQKSYIPVERIGEGSFSLFYKAINVCHHYCNNSSWINYSLQDPEDFFLFDRANVDKLHPKTNITNCTEKLL